MGPLTNSSVFIYNTILFLKGKDYFCVLNQNEPEAVINLSSRNMNTQCIFVGGFKWDYWFRCPPAESNLSVSPSAPQSGLGFSARTTFKVQ